MLIFRYFATGDAIAIDLNEIETVEQNTKLAGIYPNTSRVKVAIIRTKSGREIIVHDEDRNVLLDTAKLKLAYLNGMKMDSDYGLGLANGMYAKAKADQS